METSQEPKIYTRNLLKVLETRLRILRLRWYARSLRFLVQRLSNFLITASDNLLCAERGRRT